MENKTHTKSTEEDRKQGWLSRLINHQAMHQLAKRILPKAILKIIGLVIVLSVFSPTVLGNAQEFETETRTSNGFTCDINVLTETDDISLAQCVDASGQLIPGRKVPDECVIINSNRSTVALFNSGAPTLICEKATVTYVRGEGESDDQRRSCFRVSTFRGEGDSTATTISAIRI